MLSDDDLNHFRERFVEEVMRPMAGTDHRFDTWTDLLAEPCAPTISAFLYEPLLPEDVAGNFTALLLSIGLATAADVLKGVPLPIDYPGVSMRRWQLRRELDRAVERMTDAQLQALVFHVRGVLA